jgi:DNA ligase-1
VLAWRESPQGGRALAFTVLQQRLARKKVAPSLMERIPVRFIAYDLLFQDGAWLLAEPIEARRARLEALGVMVSPLERLGDSAEIEPRFMAARGRGNEGLILKQSGTPYEPGKRSGLWIKVKRPYGTLDVVVTAAEQGHGRRATVLSDYTFAVREGERFLNVGRAYSGLTDEEIRELTRIFRAATVERFGRVSQVKPEVVIEVAFDGIQRSPRHKSGYALRFPRIVSWRRDKKVEEIDTIEQVKALYEASLEA